MVVTSACNKGKVVLIGGKHYTGLSWFVGKEPSRQVCRDVPKDCADNALELRNGDLRCLTKQNWARLPSESLTPLFKSATMKPSDKFVDTIVPTDNGKLQIRRVNRKLTVSNRQALWLATDLVKFFQGRRGA